MVNSKHDGHTSVLKPGVASLAFDAQSAQQSNAQAGLCNAEAALLMLPKDTGQAQAQPSDQTAGSCTKDAASPEVYADRQQDTVDDNVGVHAGLLRSHSEQSDFELAMRLQEHEHALQRQHSRPVVNGRLGTKQKQRQASGTLHAFFKKA